MTRGEHAPAGGRGRKSPPSRAVRQSVDTPERGVLGLARKRRAERTTGSFGCARPRGVHMTRFPRRLLWVGALTAALLVPGTGSAGAHEHPTPTELAAPGVVYVETRARVEV